MTSTPESAVERILPKDDNNDPAEDNQLSKDRENLLKALQSGELCLKREVEKAYQRGFESMKRCEECPFPEKLKACEALYKQVSDQRLRTFEKVNELESRLKTCRNQVLEMEGLVKKLCDADDGFLEGKINIKERDCCLDDLKQFIQSLKTEEGK